MELVTQINVLPNITRQNPNAVILQANLMKYNVAQTVNILR